MVTDSDKKYSICVYCASGPVDESFLALASEVGTAIGRRGWQLVSGGGNVSMMGAVAESARAACAWTVGVIPKALVHTSTFALLLRSRSQASVLTASGRPA